MGPVTPSIERGIHRPIFAKGGEVNPRVDGVARRLNAFYISPPKAIYETSNDAIRVVTQKY